MKLGRFSWPLLLALSLMPITESPARAEAKFEAIKMKDLASSLTVQLQWSWHAIGIDPDDNVYVVFGGMDGDSADCALFQYSAKTGEKRLIGTLSEAAKKAGTWREGERIEKGHTHLPWLDGKIFIGTMGFHDASNASPSQMQLAAKSHGAHIMAYDPKADKLEDLSANQPDGVFYPHRGFMCMSAWPEEKLILGLTVPQGDLLLYDPATGQPRVSVPGVPEEFGKHVTREVVPAPNGKIYYMYSGDAYGKDPGHMYYYDTKTKQVSKCGDVDPYYWNGSVRTKDNKSIFIMTDEGYVYLLHPESDSVEKIGCLFPESERAEVMDKDGVHLFQKTHVLGMVMSADEKAIYSIPLRKRILKAEAGAREEGEKLPNGPQVPLGLYRFDIATRTSKRIADVPAEIGNGYITGTDVCDSEGNIYFARHGGSFLGLLKVNPGE